MSVEVKLSDVMKKLEDLNGQVVLKSDLEEIKTDIKELLKK